MFDFETRFEDEDGNKVHSTPLKRLINPTLRKLQLHTNEPYVIYSVFNGGKFVKYGFGRIRFNK